MVFTLILGTPAARSGVGDDFPNLMPELTDDLVQIQRDINSYPDRETRVAVANDRLLSVLNESRAPLSGRRAFIPHEEAEAIVQAMSTHPVVGNRNYDRYDPDGNWGFCFGRATWAYLELLQRGVAKESIRKIFAIGPMRAGGIDWQFHVATIVRGENGKWWVVDNYPGAALEVKNWMEIFRKQNSDGSLMFSLSDPKRMNGFGNGKFDARHFVGVADPNYKAYFDDMMTSFRDVARLKVKSRQCSRVFAVPPSGTPKGKFRRFIEHLFPWLRR